MVEQSVIFILLEYIVMIQKEEKGGSVCLA